MNWRMIKKKRVLVVEDSISSRRYLCKKLQDAGFDTFEAVRGGFLGNSILLFLIKFRYYKARLVWGVKSLNIQFENF